jgi:exonuclease SbcD
MKLLHVADLHIGRRIGEFNLLNDQRHILDQILNIADEEKPDGILIAGDVYDKSMPPGDAVELLDDFLTDLVARKLPVFMVGGNHDSPERLNFGSRIMVKNGVHIAGVFVGTLRKESLDDEFGRVNIYMLPYVKPALVRPYFEGTIESYDDAVRAVTSAAEVDRQERNILVAHQFVTSGGQQPERCESESIAVGGLDNVDASAFDAFDYVALGHLHGPQRIGRDTIRYAGSPLKYSFSEARQHKSVTIIELEGKDKIQIRMIALLPLHDMREIKGPIAELLRVGAQDTEHAQDYIHATLTDEDELYDAIGQLRVVYPNLMHLDFENSRTAAAPSKTSASGDVVRKTPMELFTEFYQNQNNMELTAEQQQMMQAVFAQAGGAVQ